MTCDRKAIYRNSVCVIPMPSLYGVPSRLTVVMEPFKDGLVWSILSMYEGKYAFQINVDVKLE